MTILSFTGIDDFTDINQLVRHISEYRENGGSIDLDFGVLFFPERQGLLRNPGYLRRLEVRKQFYSTAHLCGKDIFNSILYQNDSICLMRIEELAEYSCIQLNINARERVFDTKDVHEIYDNLFTENHERNLVLQYHSDSESDILSYLDTREELVGSSFLERIQILLDDSRGKGKVRDNWKVPERLKNYDIRIAGGINPDNISDIYKKFSDVNGMAPYIMDMESGVRTDNNFDVSKVMSILNNPSLEFLYL